jgi:ParB family chromosome partitioning protein
MKLSGLGKGLSALIVPNDNVDENTIALEVDINKVEPNPEQPRRHFDESALAELAESIKQHGVLQPLLVKQEDGFFTLIAGERRWRAARLAKLTHVPVIVKDFTPLETLQVSLIENLQRADLTLIEEALGYRRLSDEFSLTQEEIAASVNKNRSYISNAIRILELDKRVQTFIGEGRLSMGHAKLLLPIKCGDTQFEITEAVLDEELSVRDAEVLVKKYFDGQAKEEAKEPKPQKRDAQYSYIEGELNTLFGTNVKIVSGKKRGKIEIEYFTEDDLNRLLELIKLKMA